jgi:hypothetical protein
MVFLNRAFDTVTSPPLDSTLAERDRENISLKGTVSRDGFGF